MISLSSKLGRRKFLATGVVCAAALGSSYLLKDKLSSLTEMIPSPKPTVNPTITPTLPSTLTPTSTPSPTPSLTTTLDRSVDLELQLFHDYHGDGAKQNDEPVVSNVKFDVLDIKGNRVLAGVRGNDKGIYRLDSLIGKTTYFLDFDEESRETFSYYSKPDGSFGPTTNCELQVNSDKIMRLGLMVGPFTLPFPKGTFWHYEVWSFMDLGGRRDWKGTQQTYAGHIGTDFFMREGNTILAAAPGKVVKLNSTYDPMAENAKKYLGNYVDISHKGGLHTQYFHLKMTKVNVGQTVLRGQEIGVSGHTGFAYVGSYMDQPLPESLAHLHFGVSTGELLTGTIDPFRNIRAPYSRSFWTKDNDPHYPITS